MMKDKKSKKKKERTAHARRKMNFTHRSMEEMTEEGQAVSADS
jgi:hypothetical protein